MVLTSFAFLLSSAALALAVTPELKVHPEGHYLMTQQGEPFFWLGDTAWELFHRLNREEAIRYLDNRAQLGFTVVQAVAIAELDGVTVPNAYGCKPFDFAKGPKEPEPIVADGPDNDYWDHVDFIVKAANDRGITVAMLPTWGRWWKQNAVFTAESGRRYCEWLAKRYRDAGIVWVLGGDRPIDKPGERAIIDAMAAGLRAGDGGKHLITFHPHGGGASSRSLPDCDWIDFHMRQNGHAIDYSKNAWERYAGTLEEARRVPAKPVIDGEPVYEGHPVDFHPDEWGYTVAADVRRAFFWDTFNGAFGHTYGHHAVWQMHDPKYGRGVNRPPMSWQEAIDAPGPRQLGLAKKLFETRAFFSRVPAPEIIVPADPPSLVPGVGTRRFVATRDRDGSFAMVYVPVGRPFTVDLSCVKAEKVRLAWYDPRTGEERDVRTVANIGRMSFTPPTVGELLDWVLTADAVSGTPATSAEGPAVDVFIGSSGLGHVTPAATAPFGLVQAGADTSAEPTAFKPDWAHTCGYQHGDEWLWRFSQTHISGTGCPSFGDIGILPLVDGFDAVREPARMDKATERAEPGSYAVTIDEKGRRIGCEVAALAHSAAYRFRVPTDAQSVKLLLDLDWGISNPGSGDCWGKYVISSACDFPSPTTVTGSRKMWIWNGYEIHFALEFSVPVRGVRRLREGDGLRGDIYELDLGTVPSGVFELRLGLSATSTEAARRNLAEETPDFDFAAVRDASAAAWRRELGKIALDAGTDPAVAASFRAALYRTLLQPNNLGDVDARPCYSTLSLWDTFRAAHPLYTILAPERVPGFVDSMVAQCERQGYLPIWGLGGSDNHCMIGHHAVPVIADAYLKGLVPETLAARAYRAVRQSLTVNHRATGDGTWGLLKEDWDVLDKYGYYPFDKLAGSYREMKVVGESAARTLECAYDDACAARFAAALGKTDDEAFFAKRAQSWKKLFDPSVGFIRGKDSKGKWREPFDPLALGGGPWTDNDFCEGNSWQYTWHVMQDVEGLIAAMGGRERFLAKLTRLFEQPTEEYAERPTGDVTGLIGQYAHGNEPSHHTIYLFTLAGRPDLAGKYVRKVFETQYAPRPDGLCGNDDCGQMAAWYVFSALGFYPVDPCSRRYVIGAPQVAGATLALPQGKTLRIVTDGFSSKATSVRRATLNGRELVDFAFTHDDLMAGGELRFEMTQNSR